MGLHRDETGAQKVSFLRVEELIGVPDAVPGFHDAIRSALTEEAVGQNIDKKLRHSVLENISRYRQVIAKSGGSPLLIEVALIYDSRMLYALGKKIDPFFVSDIVCYSDDSELDILTAWHESIEQLKATVGERQGQMIVPHPAMYDMARVSKDFADYFFRLETPAPDSPPLCADASVLAEYWPESDGAPVGVESTQNDLLLPSQDLGQPFRQKYPFDLKPEEASLERVVDRLVRGFIARIAWQAEARKPGSCARALAKLAPFKLLIVPFRRPAGTESRQAAPGGCLFTIFRDLSPENPVIDDMLALRLSYVLSRAALAEAITDIDLQNESTRALVVQTHLLGNFATAIRDGFDNLREVVKELDGNSNKQHATPDWQAEKINDADYALQKFSDLAFVTRGFQKIREGADPIPPNMPIEGAERIATQLRIEIEKCWGFAARLKGRTEGGLPSISCRLGDIHLVQTDERYLKIVLIEASSNILKHGGDVRSEAVSFVLHDSSDVNDVHIWLEVRNPVPQDSAKLSALRKTLAENLGLMGLASLRYAAGAWALPQPEWNLSADGTCFVLRLPIGKAEKMNAFNAN
jgi:hypothetical protein